MKDDDNSLQPRRAPGPLIDLLGGRVEQWYAVQSADQASPGDIPPVTGTWGTTTSKIWAEQLSTSAPDTEVLMRYGKSNGYLDGQPAAITRKVGKGRITYIGAWMDDATLLTAARWMAETSGVTPALGPVPEGIEVYPREGAGKRLFILVNFAATPQTVTLPSPMHSILDDKDLTTVPLAQYGVAILQAK